jgi:hypothetical protein
MARIKTPAYRIEYRDNLLAMGRAGGDARSLIDGKRVYLATWKKTGISHKALENWRKTYNASFQPGMINARISDAFGVIPHIYYARIVRQRDNVVMCETTMPTFEVI